jgi:hypothetical protein
VAARSRRLAGTIQEQLLGELVPPLRQRPVKARSRPAAISRQPRRHAAPGRFARKTAGRAARSRSATGCSTDCRRASEKPLGWWALGRIGARQSLYGSAHQVVAARRRRRWLDGLLAVDWKKVEPAAFAATQLARLTGDRSRDLPDGVRQEVSARLSAINANSHWIEQINSVVELDKADERRAFGESLPAGLRLVHDDGRAQTVPVAQSAAAGKA